MRCRLSFSPWWSFEKRPRLTLCFQNLTFLHLASFSEIRKSYVKYPLNGFRAQEVISFFAKTIVERTPTGIRQSVQQDGNRKRFWMARFWHDLDSGKIGHTFVNNCGLAGFVLCSKDYSQRVAFGLIDKAIEILIAKVSPEAWMSTSRPLDVRVLQELFRAYKNPAEADSLLRVQQELDDTKVVLVHGWFRLWLNI